MRILADENFPGTAVNELRKRGHNVVWVRTAKPGIEDRAILEWAQTENRLLVTLDKDFGELAFGRDLRSSFTVRRGAFQDEPFRCRNSFDENC